MNAVIFVYHTCKMSSSSGDGDNCNDSIWLFDGNSCSSSRCNDTNSSNSDNSNDTLLAVVVVLLDY